MIEIAGLVKAYRDVTAVDGLSFRVEPAEVLGLVGPTGAGKTTTLRCLAGILPPTSGRIRIAGYDLKERPIEAKRRLAFMPDEPRFFEHLTVSDHLTLAARLYQVEDAAEKGRAQKQRRSAGVEAMGMRLLSFGMSAVVLLVASIPAAAIGGLLFFLT